MNRFAYWLCFTLIAIPSAYSFIYWPFSLFSIAVPFPPLLSIFLSFGSLVPTMLAPMLPVPILVMLGYTMTFLILRRAWLSIVKKERVPNSFRGAPKLLGYIGVCSFVLASIGMLLSIVLHAGSGVPAGMLAIPAMFCIPWSFFLTEIFSFGKVTNQS